LVIKKNHPRHLYLLLLGEDIRPHIRKRAGSGNVDRHTRRAMTAMGIPCKQPASPTTLKEDGGRDHLRYSICPQLLRTEK
jgi:hypothetical protein